MLWLVSELPRVMSGPHLGLDLARLGTKYYTSSALVLGAEVLAELGHKMDKAGALKDTISCSTRPASLRLLFLLSNLHA